MVKVRNAVSSAETQNENKLLNVMSILEIKKKGQTQVVDERPKKYMYLVEQVFFFFFASALLAACAFVLFVSKANTIQNGSLMGNFILTPPSLEWGSQTMSLGSKKERGLKGHFSHSPHRQEVCLTILTLFILLFLSPGGIVFSSFPGPQWAG